MVDLAARRLYLCTPDRPDLEPFLAACIRGGVDIVQLRDKELEARPLLERARLALRVCRGLGVPFVLNDRPDLALELGADGVHVGQDDMPVDRARKLVGDDALVGLSTHSMQQAQAGCRTGADYIAVGPVHATPTKEGRPAIGVEPIKYAAAHVSVPWFAIGGLDAGTVGAVVKAGARRIVVVRALADADDPEAAARALRAATNGGRRG